MKEALCTGGPVRVYRDISLAGLRRRVSLSFSLATRLRNRAGGYSPPAAALHLAGQYVLRFFRLSELLFSRRSGAGATRGL
jgi:hypothetical protein